MSAVGYWGCSKRILGDGRSSYRRKLFNFELGSSDLHERPLAKQVSPHRCYCHDARDECMQSSCLSFPAHRSITASCVSCYLTLPRHNGPTRRYASQSARMMISFCPYHISLSLSQWTLYSHSSFIVLRIPVSYRTETPIRPSPYLTHDELRMWNTPRPIPGWALIGLTMK